MSKKTLEFTKKTFPKAVRAWEIHGCDNCGAFWSIFFQLEGDLYLGLGKVQGGFYCPHCGFSNAGSIDMDRLRDDDDDDDDDE